MKEAMHWKKMEQGVKCLLCHQSCLLNDGASGICGVRENQGGKLVTKVYGMASSMNPDPIEKKPLFHFHPGSRAFSLGTVGCNFSCMHCQNHGISRARPNAFMLTEIGKDEVAKLAKKSRCQGVAWTYNEPTIWHEFALDASKVAKKAGLYTCYVTNGYIQEEPLRELAPHLDAMNIDVKAFTEEFYRKVAKARLQPVLDTCVLARELDIHVELTYLVIPGENDTEDEFKRFARWVAEALGKEVPVHFSRFYPHFQMRDRNPTPVEALQKAYQIAKGEGLSYVYLGNIPHTEQENTHCPGCGELLVERVGYLVRVDKTGSGKCPSCSIPVEFVLPGK